MDEYQLKVAKIANSRPPNELSLTQGHYVKIPNNVNPNVKIPIGAGATNFSQTKQSRT